MRLKGLEKGGIYAPLPLGIQETEEGKKGGNKS